MPNETNNIPDNPTFNDAVKWIREKDSMRRELREKIHRAHVYYIQQGYHFSDSFDICKERFSDEYQKWTGTALTERIFRNITNRAMGQVAESLTEATIVTAINRMFSRSEEEQDFIDKEIDRLSDVEDEFVEVEEEDTTGGKFEGTKTKKMLRVDRILELHQKSREITKSCVETAASLQRKGLTIVMNDNSRVSLLDDGALSQLIAASEKKHGNVNGAA